MTDKIQISGFTLIELIVVLSLLTVLLIFSFPLFKEIRFFSDTSTQAARMAIIIQEVKKKAILENQDFFLHIDTARHLIWAAGESMDDDEKQKAKENGFRLSEGTSVIDVESPVAIDPGHEESVIKFSRHGFSDHVFIHCTFDRENITLKIEPFLFEVQVMKGHVGFEACI